MMRRLTLIVLVAGLHWVPGAHAEGPVVRVSVAPEVVRVGEAAELTITVLVPTWFPKPPVYPSFELPNAMTQLPADSSYPTSERVGPPLICSQTFSRLTGRPTQEPPMKRA